MRTATGESGSDINLTPIRELEERLDNFRIQVAEDMTIRGSAWQGYALNTKTCSEMTEAQGGGGGPPTPGACCLPDGTCETVTPGQCLLAGGTFLGGDCDPNPCVMPSCTCGFDAYDGSGRRFLTETYTGSITDTGCCSEEGGECSLALDGSGLRVRHFDPDTCEETLDIIIDQETQTHCNGSVDHTTYGEYSGRIYTVISATLKQAHLHIDEDCGACGPQHFQLTHDDQYELSDECTPV